MRKILAKRAQKGSPNRYNKSPKLLARRISGHLMDGTKRVLENVEVFMLFFEWKHAPRMATLDFQAK